MDLSKYDNSYYSPGAGRIKRFLWYFVNALVFDGWVLPCSRIKCSLLRLFGATVGVGVVIKPRVNIKYPWNIVIGDYVWIGEGVWLDSLDRIIIGSNICISQDAYLLTGNHDYKDPKFGLITQPIKVDDGAWIGAKAVVCPGVQVRQNSILSVSSVLTGSTDENGIYQGNPATFIRERKISA